MKKLLTHAALAALLAGLPQLALGQSFTHWETPHVSPLDRTPDGTRLLAVNTADNRLEVFTLAGGAPVPAGSVPVGLDPVSVRARDDHEAWVVNHLSDTVSIVDLDTLHVIFTIAVGDEPADVVFAGSPQRAFVSVSQFNEIRVFDPDQPGAAPVVLPLHGEDPRALATDGTTVYAAIFESGNPTTIVPEPVVSSPVNPYPQDRNPPPNAGAGFSPAMTPGLPPPPRTSLIVRKDAGGVWRDDNNGNWSAAVTWDLSDNDVAVIDANTLAVSYAGGLMTTDMALSVRSDGQVTVVGAEATNEIRYEPNLRGRFLHVVMSSFDPGLPAAASTVDLNPHLTYLTGQAPQAQRDLSIGDPRAIVWNGAATRGYVAGMGSNNVLVIDGSGAPLARIDVPDGPTGLVLDELAGRLYVLSKFAASISVIDTGSDAVVDTLAFHDPTPAAVRDGRPFLYDTHRTSGLGQVSCASCHVDARMDHLSWDLGDPSGTVKPFNQICNGGLGVGQCENWHPMKGPLATQTLVGTVGTEPLHWRGDREDLAAFNGAFESLLGDDVQLSPAELAAFESFIQTISFPPNPYRNLDNTLPTTLFTGGNPAQGLNIYLNAPTDRGVLRCVQCHTLPTGSNGIVISAAALGTTQSLVVPQLRNMYEKTGFDPSASDSVRGFGFTHDGTIATLFDFLFAPVFTFPPGPPGVQGRRDVEAFMLCFPTDTHPAVGQQVTLAGGDPAPILNRLTQLINIANSGAVGLVAKGVQGGAARGYTYLGAGQFQSDRAGETLTTAELIAVAGVGSELTFTIVPAGSQIRIGIDRDEDGFLDADEVDACSDPADAAVTPNNAPPLPGDLDGSNGVDFADLGLLLGCWGNACGDLTGDGLTDLSDLGVLFANWGRSCGG